MKKKSQFNQDMLIIAIFTFITVSVWMAAEIYHAVITSQITEVQERLIAELDPTINNETLTKIRSRF